MHAYSNPSSQVDAALYRLAAPIEPRGRISGLSWWARDGEDFPPTRAEVVTPRALKRRLSIEQREAIVKAYNEGVLQKDLAVEYGISVRSVKRLVRHARDTGQIA
nr:sigma factor-like helix-turn-helix DNA-binding protein [Glycomyces sp. L485]